jgi:hypothetical protein
MKFNFTSDKKAAGFFSRFHCFKMLPLAAFVLIGRLHTI